MVAAVVMITAEAMMVAVISNCLGVIKFTKNASRWRSGYRCFPAVLDGIIAMADEEGAWGHPAGLSLELRVIVSEQMQA